MEYVYFKKLAEQLQRLEGQIRDLSARFSKDKLYDRWIPEIDAAAIINLSPRTLRRRY